MKFLLPTVAVFIILNLGGETTGKKILSISFFSSRSHKNVYEPLLYELASRGHTLTIVSPFKSSNPHKNYREIIGADIATFMNDTNQFEQRIKGQQLNPAQFRDNAVKLCESYYTMPEMMALLKEKFDLVIGSYFFNQCTFGFIHKIGAPFILIHPNAPLPFDYSANGSPTPLSFTPLSLLGYTDEMTFKQRLINFLANTAFGTFIEYFNLPAMEATYRKYLGEDVPGVHEIERNVSLIITNSHFSITFPRPILPDHIEVAGMHCRDSKPLPKDLEEFIQGSGAPGFIYFSLGSVVKAHTMPEEQRKALLAAFSKLKQRVIWKWETEVMPDLPPNVKLSKWLPQQDILGHPKIRLFITHGGLLSTEEAVYHGVPLVGIPIFADQDSNMKEAERNGFAKTLEFRDLTEEGILSVVNEILAEPKYAARAKELSVRFRDRMEKPLDKALFWTEYVMRHNGAPHLRSAARKLNFFQYYSIDVVGTLTAAALLLSYIVYKLVRICLRKACSLFGSRPSTPSAGKKRN